MRPKSRNPVILVADDDETVRKLLERHLSESGFRVEAAADGAQAIARLSDDTDVALLDLDMPHATGLEVLWHIEREHPDIAAIMLSAKGQIDDAVAAMKAGAIDYLTKPIDMKAVLAAVGRGARFSRLSKENRGLKQAVAGEPPRSEFLGRSAAAAKLSADIAKIAQVDSTVLVTGPSGCGKTLIARQIHYSGPRAEAPFVTVSCPALPRELLESELFGHEEGAFTGASARRIGKIELADGGTLLLDEIGELPLDLQPKLLNVLQDRQLCRVGGTEWMDIDVRVIAATNLDLPRAVAEGSFREDLYYRLNVIPLELPPLSERREDILLLARAILDRIARQHDRTPLEIEPEAAEALEACAWPGNVRQLENVLERAVAFSTGGILRAAELPPEVLSNSPGAPPLSGELQRAAGGSAVSVAGIPLAVLERMAIEQTLERCGGNQAQTARQLGVSERTIYNKLRKLKLR